LKVNEERKKAGEFSSKHVLEIENLKADLNGQIEKLRSSYDEKIADLERRLEVALGMFISIVISFFVYVVIVDAVLWSISSTFYAQIFCTKVFSAAFFYLHVTREKLPKRRSYKKIAHKMLTKLRPKGCSNHENC